MSVEETPHIVFIEEAACIGCMKCIRACPFDAIMGSKKMMHTVIPSLCVGCDLCIKPCPTDCIKTVAIARPDDNTARQLRLAAKQRAKTRLARLKRIEEDSQLPDTAKKAALSGVLARLTSKK